MPRFMITRRWIVEAEDARSALKAVRAGQHVDQTAIPLPSSVTDEDVAQLGRDAITPWWVIRGTRQARKDGQ
jgi:hypothetical protein